MTYLRRELNMGANPHHLILGQLNDFLTGQILDDTLDERYRQKIAKKLVMDKGFRQPDIISNYRLEVGAGGKTATIRVDFLVQMATKSVILVKYAPGSLVTRRLSTLALSRIIEPYQIPIVVFTNGEDAEIMDGHTGCVIAEGLDQIPEKKDLEHKISSLPFNTITASVFDKASRIAFACEIDGACPCDTDVCVVD